MKIKSLLLWMILLAAVLVTPGISGCDQSSCSTCPGDQNPPGEEPQDQLGDAQGKEDSEQGPEGAGTPQTGHDYD